MKRSEFIRKLAACDGVPFRRATLERMDAEELTAVVLNYRVGKLEEEIAELEYGLGVSGRPPKSKEDVELGFEVRNILDAPRGESVLDDDPGDEGEENAENLGFPVRSIMDGPRGASALD